MQLNDAHERTAAFPLQQWMPQCYVIVQTLSFETED
jgi:hypothetical protein